MLAYGHHDDHDNAAREMKSRPSSSSPDGAATAAASSPKKPLPPVKDPHAPHDPHHDDKPGHYDQHPQHPAGPESTLRPYVTPIITGIIGIIVITMILVGAGAGTSGKVRQKVALFILDGVKATVFEEIGIHGYRTPNLQKLAAKGAHAPCVAKTDTRCCRTQSGARLGPPFTWESAPGMATLLTGVDSPKHEVFNSTFDSLLRFASSSSKYPTWLKIATDAKLAVSAVASNAFLTTVGTNGGSCNAYGVADFECGAAALSRCMRSDSCNLKRRLPIVPNPQLPDTAAQADVTRDALGLIDEGNDVVIIHIPQPSIAATTLGAFASESRPYVAQLYLADAIVGQVARTLETRARDSHESWLLMMTSDHGGHQQAFGTVINDDNIIPLVAAVLTPGGYADLAEPVPPVRQMDVAPTILQWLGLLTADIAATLDGRTQFICGATGNCTSLTSTNIAS